MFDPIFQICFLGKHCRLRLQIPLDNERHYLCARMCCEISNLLTNYPLHY
ncbi:hypothetical protein MEK_00376 [Candida albicans 12C]|nr:hypothetical protein MEK_00376 [Candida albicans 12C]KGU37595.1 hypothetical protein MGK_00372 [Candida albicans P57055]